MGLPHNVLSACVASSHAQTVPTLTDAIIATVHGASIAHALADESVSMPPVAATATTHGGAGDIDTPDSLELEELEPNIDYVPVAPPKPSERKCWRVFSDDDAPSKETQHTWPVATTRDTVDHQTALKQINAIARKMYKHPGHAAEYRRQIYRALNILPERVENEHWQPSWTYKRSDQADIVTRSTLTVPLLGELGVLYSQQTIAPNTHLARLSGVWLSRDDVDVVASLHYPASSSKRRKNGGDSTSERGAMPCFPHLRESLFFNRETDMYLDADPGLFGHAHHAHALVGANLRTSAEVGATHATVLARFETHKEFVGIGYVDLHVADDTYVSRTAALCIDAGQRYRDTAANK